MMFPPLDLDTRPHAPTLCLLHLGRAFAGVASLGLFQIWLRVVQPAALVRLADEAIQICAVVFIRSGASFYRKVCCLVASFSEYFVNY
ncbi:hypothetical protein C1H46_021059 [Malus baccata]|uniref:Uncharacterized protein n=1 Tax=Malus baccata TaxID=106549 RepID=A0A540M3I1_MALBA|nr:hypothetical protein C1H46_021059 [Malus baccata]